MLQFFGTLHCEISTWYDSLLKKDKYMLGMLHYRVLRTVVKDWCRVYPRDMLDTLGHAKPHIFAKYSLGSIIINTYTTHRPGKT